MWLKNSVQHTAALTSGFRKCRWQQRLHLYVSPGWKETTRTLPLPELAAQFLVAGWKIIKPRVMFQKNILIISNPDVQDVGRNSIFLAAASPHSLLISPRYKWNKFLRLWDETTERNRITLIWTWTSRNPVTDNSTELGKKASARFHECSKQVRAEVISNCRNKLHQTWPKPFSRAL